MGDLGFSYRLLVYSLGINLASLFFMAAATILHGPVAGLVVFVLSVFTLLCLIYWLHARKN